MGNGGLPSDKAMRTHNDAATSLESKLRVLNTKLDQVRETAAGVAAADALVGKNPARNERVRRFAGEAARLEREISSARDQLRKYDEFKDDVASVSVIKSAEQLDAAAVGVLNAKKKALERKAARGASSTQSVAALRVDVRNLEMTMDADANRLNDLNTALGELMRGDETETAAETQSSGVDSFVASLGFESETEAPRERERASARPREPLALPPIPTHALPGFSRNEVKN